jgi:ABC-type transport system substrate-binding protein
VSASPGLDSLGPRWNDPELDKLLAQARVTADGPDRRALYVTIQKRLMDTVPTFWFHNEYNFEAVQTSLKGFLQYPPARRALSLRASWLDRA